MVAVQIFPRRTVFYFRIFHWELFHWRSVLEKSWELDTCFCLSVEEKKKETFYLVKEKYIVCAAKITMKPGYFGGDVRESVEIFFWPDLGKTQTQEKLKSSILEVAVCIAHITFCSFLHHVLEFSLGEWSWHTHGAPGYRQSLRVFSVQGTDITKAQHSWNFRTGHLERNTLLQIWTFHLWRKWHHQWMKKPHS